MKNKRLIEVAFPIKQTSLASVHEKNIRHGHISTLHIWPARRPLAASRAALIAALLPAPHNPNEIGLLLERISGKSIETIEQRHVNGHTVEQTKEEAVGGVLRWGQENSLDIQRFQEEIRKIHAGRAPKVLDPFAGGGAIPLEAMRLGCEVTALDINPVAWFILKCTLEYPQKLAGQTCSLPEFVLKDHDFMAAFLKAKGLKGTNLQSFLKKFTQGDKGEIQLNLMSRDDPMLEADLAWHVRAWGRWILAKVRSKLASYYPTYAEFEPLKTGKDFEPRSICLLKENQEGIPQIDSLNAEFDEIYLKNPLNPRWVAKPTVAYLWARAVQCKQCRATLPLLKTCWLCKKDKKYVRLTINPDEERKSVIFGIQVDAPEVGSRRVHNKHIATGTMSRTGATCPLCQAIMTMEDIRIEGRAGRLTKIMTAVVVNGLKGKEYRLPTVHEREMAKVSKEQLQGCYEHIPFGLMDESTPKSGSGAARAFSVAGYGLDTWQKLFTNRQLLTLGTFVQTIRQLSQNPFHLPPLFNEAVIAYLALVNDRLADYSNAICSWHNSGEKIRSTFARFALPIVWDFAEVNPLSDFTGNYLGAVEWVSRAISHTCLATDASPAAKVLHQSALEILDETIDLIITDPPYYDAIPYSDAMDFFHVWLRRSTYGLSPEIKAAFREPLSPKWDHDAGDGELIDDASRFGGDKARSKKNYEDGMARAFQACHKVLQPDGRLVVVFANKQPDAWETLVSALIRAGFVVTASWPIQTEMTTRTRAMASAALSSSIWLVCRKRSNTRPGWDNLVLQDMRENIIQQLRDFWDAGIRGPDFVWSATGPALEAFSAYPIVKQANAPNQFMDVVEFLREVRRIVVDFVVGRVLSRDGHEAVSGLDDVTTYYLLHRHDYRMDMAPVGSCILYALSCNLSNTALVNQYDLLTQSGRSSTRSTAEDNATEAAGSSSGTTVRLKAWSQRKGRKLGLEAPVGQPIPLIDQVHRLMHLWRAGDSIKVNEYLDLRGLQQSGLFPPLLQALIELADVGSDERSLLEALSNHIAARGDIRAPSQQQLL